MYSTACRAHDDFLLCALSSNLKEWLDYHLLIGIQHFFLLSNECDRKEAAAAREVLEPYIDDGYVSLSTKYVDMVSGCT